jgi:signal transduction histidine kinase
VLDETLELLGGKFREQNISVRKHYGVEGRIQAAPTELRQVFANLLVNALAATPAGGKVAVHVFASRDWRRPERRGIRVVIADTGVGIPYEHQQKIFEPFFTTKGEKGTGLGLYVINSIVKKYEGTIRLRSSTVSGKSGTCFSIFFPTKTADNPVPGRP